MFESGVVKLSCGDKTWRNLTALNTHFMTQPLPTWMGWYFHQSPPWFRKLSTLMVYAIEIGLPIFIFISPETRVIACAGFVFLMLVIFVTGNYTFFNLITVSLCLLLLGDTFWEQILPHPLQVHILFSLHSSKFSQALLFAQTVLLGGVLFISLPQLLRSIFPKISIPNFLKILEYAISPFRIINSYGLFRVMTTTRPEIQVEGSYDGKIWLPYSFKYKPGDLDCRPKFVEPHQPRLDWQLWFAALSSFQSSPWFHNFCIRLLQASPDVLKLIQKNPFPQKPPRYVRALLYDYRFTTQKEKKDSGQWWTKEYLGVYSPILSIK